jgi:hypothetical protein
MTGSLRSTVPAVTSTIRPHRRTSDHSVLRVPHSLVVCTTLLCLVHPHGTCVGVGGDAPSVTAPTERVLTPTQRARLISDFRARSPDQRPAIAQEMARFRDLELTRFLAQHGLRDRSPQVVEAVHAALIASRGDTPHDALVIDLWRSELRSGKRPAGDYSGRLAIAVGNRRSLSAWNELARVALDSGQPRHGECLDALLVAVDRAGLDRDPAAIDALEQWVAAPWFDQSQGIRRSVVNAARRFDDPRATGLLITCLERTDGEMRFTISERLAHLTGQKLGADAKAWRTWWRANWPERQAVGKPEGGNRGDPNSVPGPAATVGKSDDRFDNTREPSARGADLPGKELAGAPLYYYDLPVRAERVVFVLDVSKSMGLGGTTSRLAAAQRELVRTIGSLADGTLFNIVVFHDDVALWQERLYPATMATRAHAAAFVRGQRPQGKTATYDALRAALSMSPTPEAIYFLSDGMPSSGDIVAPERVLDAVRRDNQRLGVAVHSLGTLAGPRDAGFADFLEKLAGQNHGQFRRLE